MARPQSISKLEVAGTEMTMYIGIVAQSLRPFSRRIHFPNWLDLAAIPAINYGNANSRKSRRKIESEGQNLDLAAWALQLQYFT